MPVNEAAVPARRRSDTLVTIPGRSAWLYAAFRRYGRRYVARHFHAVRLSRGGPLPAIPDGPLIVVLNHPSWWDPMIGLVLSDLMPGRVPYAPIDARALARYRFLERLGFFGIETGTARGGMRFLRTARAILARPSSALWITAQGRFTDPRDRPARLLKGVGHLAMRLDVGNVLPLALEYPFWDEREPEALAAFGAIIPIDGPRTAGEWTVRIGQELEATQDRLAREARGRDPAAFEMILPGRAGVGGLYDAGRRLRAYLRGERFRPEHGAGDGGP